jgi:hypothetical protein
MQNKLSLEEQLKRIHLSNRGLYPEKFIIKVCKMHNLALNAMNFNYGISLGMPDRLFANEHGDISFVWRWVKRDKNGEIPYMLFFYVPQRDEHYASYKIIARSKNLKSWLKKGNGILFCQ